MLKRPLIAVHESEDITTTTKRRKDRQESCGDKGHEENLVEDKNDVTTSNVVGTGSQNYPFIIPDIELRGRGTQEAPFWIPQWTTGSEILEGNHGDRDTVSDEEDTAEETENHLPDAVSPSDACISRGSTSGSQDERTTSVSDGPRERLIAFDGGCGMLQNKVSEYVDEQETYEDDSDTDQDDLLESYVGDGQFLDLGYVEKARQVSRAIETNKPVQNYQPIWNRAESELSLEEAQDGEEETDDDCPISLEIPIAKDTEQPSIIVEEESRATEKHSETSSLQLSVPHDMKTLDSHYGGVAISKTHLATTTTDSGSGALHATCPTPSQTPIWADELECDERLPVATRKRLFFDTYHHKKRAVMQRAADTYDAGIESRKLTNGCWLYKGPRLPKKPQSGVLHTKITFHHKGRSERISLHILFVKMLLEGALTKEHIDGIVNESWHASHLCGNWTCLNTKHIVPESGHINSNRNVCFRDVNGPCRHSPKCLKHLKLRADLLCAYDNPAAPKTLENIQGFSQ